MLLLLIHMFVYLYDGMFMALIVYLMFDAPVLLNNYISS